MGRKQGISEQQLLDLAHFEASPAFSALEKLVLRYAVAMTETPVEVPPAADSVLVEVSAPAREESATEDLEPAIVPVQAGPETTDADEESTSEGTEDFAVRPKPTPRSFDNPAAKVVAAMFNAQTLYRPRRAASCAASFAAAGAVPASPRRAHEAHGVHARHRDGLFG